MQYRRFEDIPVWQDARTLMNDVYALLRGSESIKRDFILADQLKRAAFSILLNIAEGFERGSNTEFANFINISKGSAGEIRSILYVMKDNKLIEETTFENLYKKVTTISHQLSGFRAFLLAHKTRKK